MGNVEEFETLLSGQSRVITPSVDRRERRRMQKDSAIFLERTGEGHVVHQDHFETIAKVTLRKPLRGSLLPEWDFSLIASGTEDALDNFWN